MGRRLDIDPVRPVLNFAHRLADQAPSAVLALVILVCTYVLSRFFSGRLRRVLELGGFQVNVAILLARALWITAWSLGIVLVLYLFGVGLTPLAALIGVVGLAASLSLQQVLQNLVAGVYLLAERPFEIGDLIQIVGAAGVNHEGTVMDVQMRMTRLRSHDDELILIPNAAIFSGVVTNRTAVGGHITHVTITFPRETDPATVRDRAVPLLQSLPTVMAAPPPRMRIDTVGTEHWTGSLAFWSDTWESASDAIWAFGRAFPEATINEPPTAVV